MEYKILEAQSIKDLTGLVNDIIKLGWKPQGGIAVTKNQFGNSVYVYYQVVILN